MNDRQYDKLQTALDTLDGSPHVPDGNLPLGERIQTVRRLVAEVLAYGTNDDGLDDD